MLFVAKKCAHFELSHERSWQWARAMTWAQRQMPNGEWRHRQTVSFANEAAVGWPRECRIYQTVAGPHRTGRMAASPNWKRVKRFALICLFKQFLLLLLFLLLYKCLHLSCDYVCTHACMYACMYVCVCNCSWRAAHALWRSASNCRVLLACAAADELIRLSVNAEELPN